MMGLSTFSAAIRRNHESRKYGTLVSAVNWFKEQSGRSKGWGKGYIRFNFVYDLDNKLLYIRYGLSKLCQKLKFSACQSVETSLLGRSGNLRYPNEGEFENGPIGRKGNFDSVGCTERAEDRKTKQCHPKKEGGS